MSVEQAYIPPVRPTSADQLAQTVASAAAAGRRLRIAGAGSMGGTTAPAGAQVVSTLRMNKVIEHAVADMTVIVDAGITLEALQRELAWKNQWLPVDPPAVNGRSPGSRTLGGIIATNSLGPLRFGIGDWRFLMLGMQWVNDRGHLIRGGGRTVKFSAGYHTARLLIGSRGTLGAIAQLTLRTFARPADEQALVIFCDSPSAAERILAELLPAPVTPAYVQLIGHQAFVGNPLQLPAAPMTVVVGFLDRPHLCAAQVEAVRRLPAVASCETISQTAAQCGRLRLWMTTEPAGVLGFRLYTPSSAATAAIAAIEQAARAADGTAWLVAEAGAAVIRGSLQHSPPDRLPAFLTALAHITRDAAGELDFLYGAPEEFTQRTETPLHTQLRTGLDPDHRFA